MPFLEVYLEGELYLKASGSPPVFEYLCPGLLTMVERHRQRGVVRWDIDAPYPVLVRTPFDDPRYLEELGRVIEQAGIYRIVLG